MIKIDPTIFRAYDTRGIYPNQVNADVAYLISRALVRFLAKVQNKRNNELRVVLSRDGRLSSPELHKAVKKGVLDEGAGAIDIGLSSTPMFYFSVWNYDYDGGVQITASHNPPQYNGFKLNQKNASMIAGNTGIDQIKEMVLEMALQDLELMETPGQIAKKDVLDDYLKMNLESFDLEKFKNFKIVIDTANGATGLLIERFADFFPGQIKHLFKEVDGSFPNHPPDPSKPANMIDLQKAVKDQQANLGIAFDADGDRIAIVDEQGEIAPASSILSLLSQKILKDNPGEHIVYNFMSNIAPETIKQNGGKPIETRVGFTFVKEKMKEFQAFFGGEYSGHFLFKKHNFCEAPLLVLFYLLDEIAGKQKPLSELVWPFQKYFLSDILNLEIHDKEAALRALEEKYQEGKISHLDGVRIDFNDWWLHARPSNTENVLRVIVEAKDQKIAQQKLAEIKGIIESA